MINRHLFLWVVLVGMLLFPGCREKDLDMTLMQKTLYEGVELNDITAEDAWCVIIVYDAEKSYLEMEYSAFLEDYILVKQEGTSVRIGFNRSLYYLPSNTVKNITIHTPSLKRIHFEDAVSAALEGKFPETEFTMELEDASKCRGGQIFGSAEIKMSDASTCVEFSFDGTNCMVELKDASVFKGSLNVSGDLTMTIKDASRLTEYWGEINHATVEVSDASNLNMATSWIKRMHITVKSASEATVNVEEVLEGSVRGASKLYYSGDPIVNVDCDESSTIVEVEYPDPD